MTLVILSAYSCGCERPAPEVNNLVVGTWKLQTILHKSCKVMHAITETSTCLTTETVTKNIILNLDANNNYSFVTDGVRTSQGTYSFSEKNSQVHGSIKQFLDFSNDGSFVLDTNNGKLGLEKYFDSEKKYLYEK